MKQTNYKLSNRIRCIKIIQRNKNLYLKNTYGGGSTNLKGNNSNLISISKLNST